MKHFDNKHQNTVTVIKWQRDLKATIKYMITMQSIKMLDYNKQNHDW